MAKISMVSLGCDKNLVDSEVMLGLLKENGHQVIDNESEADIIVINTCSFIEDALNESIETILEMARYKETGNLKGLIVAGCLPQRYQDEVFKQLPEADIILGTAAYGRINEAVERLIDQKEKAFLDSVDNTPPEEALLRRLRSSIGQYHAYLKIAEGCDNHCTYCIIPKLRGKYRSRTIESLVKEAEILVGQGIREIILVAQDTSVYGLDLYGEIKLPQLIEKLSAIEDLQWIRLLYCYPENISGSLIDLFANNPKLCHYIDMPIQHASDEVLKKMGRKTSRSSIEKTINALLERVPDMALRTSIITGFPGETEGDFDELAAFIKGIQFDRLGVFPFSREEGTPAYQLPNQLPKQIKLQRKNRLMKIQKEITEEKSSSFIGREMDLLVEGKLADDDVYVCRSYRDAPDVDGIVFLHSARPFDSGVFVKAVITDVFEYDMQAECVEVENESGQ